MTSRKPPGRDPLNVPGPVPLLGQPRPNGPPPVGNLHLPDGQVLTMEADFCVLFSTIINAIGAVQFQVAELRRDLGLPPSSLTPRARQSSEAADPSRLDTDSLDRLSRKP